MALRRLIVIGGAVALTIGRAAGDVPRVRGERRDRAGDLHAGAVRRAVRLDRAVVHQCARRLLSRCSRRRLPSRHGPDSHCRRCHAHRAADADLQREPARIMAGLQAIDEVAARSRARAMRSTCSSSATPPIRTSGSPRRRASWRCASAPAISARIFYRRRAEEHRAQGRQHRRLGDALRRRLCAVPDPRRRQPDERRARWCGWSRAMERHPDVGLIQTLPIITGGNHAVRPRAAIRRPGLRPADRARHRLVARRGGQLLGPQRA